MNNRKNSFNYQNKLFYLLILALLSTIFIGYKYFKKKRFNHKYSLFTLESNAITSIPDPNSIKVQLKFHITKYPIKG